MSAEKKAETGGGSPSEAAPDRTDFDVQWDARWKKQWSGMFKGFAAWALVWAARAQTWGRRARTNSWSSYGAP